MEFPPETPNQPQNQQLVVIPPERKKGGRPKGSKDKYKRRSPRMALIAKRRARAKLQKAIAKEAAEARRASPIGQAEALVSKPRPRCAKYEPTKRDREIVQCLAMMGKNSDEIALIMGTDGRSIRREHLAELDWSLEKAVALIAGNLWKQGMKDSSRARGPAAEFLEKFGGYVPTARVESTGKDGGPIKSEHKSVTFVMHLEPGDENL